MHVISVALSRIIKGIPYMRSISSSWDECEHPSGGCTGRSNLHRCDNGMGTRVRNVLKVGQVFDDVDVLF